MRDVTPVVLLLTLGSLIFLSGCSSRVWRGDEARYRPVATIVGLILIVMGGLALFGYMEIKE